MFGAERVLFDSVVVVMCGNIAAGTAMSGALARFDDEAHEPRYFGSSARAPSPLASPLPLMRPAVRRAMGGAH